MTKSEQLKEVCTNKNTSPSEFYRVMQNEDIVPRMLKYADLETQLSRFIWRDAPEGIDPVAIYNSPKMTFQEFTTIKFNMRTVVFEIIDKETDKAFSVEMPFYILDDNNEFMQYVLATETVLKNDHNRLFDQLKG